ncbi:MAG: hypothetical protein ASARMPRED_001750 [Alectoria sarmentosa]|nr:MAG: hypothetical protein ASARMPRED_001750 [Alectoria sarmentosa]
MTDPISIIGLLGTAVTLTKTVLDYLSAVKDAPEELEKLSCELTHLSDVFEQVFEVIEGEDSRDNFAEASTLYNAAGDLVITLESFRARLEATSTAKGLRKIYDRLKWPINGPDTQKLLQTVQRNTQIFHFALTAKGIKIVSQTSGKASEILSASRRNSQTQSEILRAIVALPNQNEIMVELKKLHFHLNEDRNPWRGEDRFFLRQLSTLDFTAMQKESYSKRHGKTGQWLLDSPDFQSWLKSEDAQHSVLWCPGNPGVGKTVITSIAVNHITENTGGRRRAIVYIYCDYVNNMTFSVRNLLGSLVRQLVAQTTHARTIAELKRFVNETAKNRNMTEEELSFLIETFSRNFDVVYTCVDALDECPEIGRETFLRRLQQYSLGNMRVFLTSRFNVDVTVKIPHAMRAPIEATSDDVTAYVESKIYESSRLARFVARDPKLKRHIIHSIASQADGMFLLAGLQIDGLASQTSARGVRSALERLPTDVFAMYDQTIERIRDQSKEDAELGMKVLSIVFGATTPLEIDELRHALAIQPGDADLDFEALVDLDILLSVTAGLVITYEDKDCDQELFRLVLYTLQEYLESNQELLFPDLGLEMARACLSYLSLGEFGSGPRASRKLFRERMDRYYFYDYAAHNWALHLRGMQVELMDQSLAFVLNCEKTSAWLQCFEYVESADRGLSSFKDLPLDPIFLASHFHLLELFTRLISSRDINTRNNRGETPLLRAVDVSPWQKGGEPPYLDFTNAQTWHEGVEPPLIQSLDVEQHAMVQLILDHNADIDAKDPLYRTAAFRAIENENGGILPLLLDCGADIEVRLEDGHSLLHIAAEKERRVDIMQFLLDRGADINALTDNLESLVHIAAIHPTSAMLDCLIGNGALFDSADLQGVTPLLLAARRGRLQTLTALIKRGARLDIRHPTGQTPLHFAFSHLAVPEPDVVEVLMRTQEVNVIDIKGRTPLHYAYFKSAQEKWNTSIADMIRQLIKGGASETIADADGKLPKDYSNWSTWEHGREWKRDYWRLTHTSADDGRHRTSEESQTQDINDTSEENAEADEEERESNLLNGHTN